MLIKIFYIVLLTFFSTYVCAQNTWIVKNIKIKGLHFISQTEVLKNIHLKVGHKISQNDIQNSIKSLFNTKRFEDITVRYLKQSLIFEVKEKPIISDIIITGNNIIHTSILNNYLKKLGILKHHPLNPFLMKLCINTIKDFYHDLGRSHFSVKMLKIFSINNTVILRIVIHEGFPIKINDIKISGNKSFSQEKIISLLNFKHQKHWWNFLDKRVYSLKDLKNNLKNVSNYYSNQGYFYFVLDENSDREEINFFDNEDNVNVLINISEGNIYRISHFFINGNLLGYSELIKDVININNNELYNKEKIDLIAEKIKILLSENGYIHAEVIVVPEIKYGSNKIILNFNVDMQRRFFVNKISFKGNEITQDAVLRREMMQMEGEYINLKNIELGKKRLEKTKYFSEVKVTQNIISYNSNLINIIYEVKEQQTGSINFGLGYGADSGISLKASISQDNAFGSGNSFKFNAIKNAYQKYADLSMNYPYFISGIAGLNTRFFYNDLQYYLNNVSDTIKNTYGFESDLGFSINDTNTFNIGLGYTHNGMNSTRNNKNVLLPQETISDIEIFKNSLVNDFTFNYSWMFSSLESLYFPLSGNQTYISGKNTIPGSDNNFYKIILDTEEYIPLNQRKDFIFLTHIHMGIGNSFNENKLPFYENFYTGVSNNIRGFRSSTIGPKTVYHSANPNDCIGHMNKNVCESIDSIGGNLNAVSNLALITPIPFIDNDYSKTLRPSFFLDAGNIWNANINKVNLSEFLFHSMLHDIHISYGFSLQWFSPIGPLSFSYAYPWKQYKSHQLEAFQFNFGKNW